MHDKGTNKLLSDIAAATPAAQHTPGPWHVDECRTPNGVVYEVNSVAVLAGDDEGEPAIVNIAECCDFTDGQAEANAHLLAAAPDLLAACKAARDAIAGIEDDELVDEAKRLIDAAFNKAGVSQ